MSFLTAAPLWLLAIALVAMTAFISMVGPIIIRKRVSLDQLKTNNEVAGFKFASVGVIYAVLLGFAVIVVWQKFSEAENDVALEAGAAATIYRLANGITGAPGLALHEGITTYLKAAISEDWPAMKRGQGSPVVTRALNNLYATLLRYEPNTAVETAVFAEV